MKSYEQFVDGLSEGTLTELSGSTLASYSKKASNSNTGLNVKKQDNRVSGVKKAADRLNKKKMSEENCNCDCGEDPCVECGKSHHKMNEAVDPNEYDREGDMAKTQLQTICRNAEDLIEMMDDDTNLPEWVQSKIVKAEDYITTVRDYLQSEMERNEMSEAVKVASKFSDMQIKQAYGILNDPRWKGGNMTSIVSRIEAIAKGLSKHPNVSRAIRKTNEELSPAQKKIDKNKNGKIDGSDLSKLRKEEDKAGNLKDACWKGYEAIGTKKKDGKTVPNCVPVKEESFKDKIAKKLSKPIKDYNKEKEDKKPIKEAELSKPEENEKERIVKGMKKSFKDFVKKYGSEKKAKEVMYATATKMAQKAK